jgi:hypothetical protein
MTYRSVVAAIAALLWSAVVSHAQVASDHAGNTASKSVSYTIGYNVCPLYDATGADPVVPSALFQIK